LLTSGKGDPGVSTKTRWMVCVFVPVILLILGVAAAAYFLRIPVGKFTRDVAAIAEVHPLKGLLSNIGILLWDTTAAICFFSGVLLLAQKKHQEALFMLSSGGLTFILALDDMFLFHDDLAKRYLGLGEKGVYLFYGFLVVVYLVFFSFRLLKTDLSLLLAAFILFCCSILVDEQKIVTGEWLYLVEDGLKMIGITSWFGYHTQNAYWYQIDAERLQIRDGFLGRIQAAGSRKLDFIVSKIVEVYQKRMK
jgi:hypothetical protein